jgi:hypothetical protein
MKSYKINVNGQSFDVTVEEQDASAPAPPAGGAGASVNTGQVLVELS